MTNVSTDIEAVYALLQQARNLDHGDQQIAFTEEAVRLADLTNDLETQFDARFELISAGVFGGADDKAFVAFSWCLAQRDRNPQLGHEFEMLWRYKWILNKIAGFSQISKSNIQQMLEDMERRYLQSNASLRPVYQHYSKVNRLYGEKQMADKYFHKWKETKRDYYADCIACEADSEVLHWIFMENPTEAINKAQSILNGTQKCAEVPHLTYGAILLPLVELGRHQEAMNYHEKGYKLVSKNKDFLIPVSEHVLFLALANELNKALRLFEKHFEWSLKIKSAVDRFYFWRAAYLLFTVLSERDKSSYKLRLPGEFKEFSESGEYQLDSLISYAQSELNQISSALDLRNGNNYYDQLYKNTPFLKRLRFQLN